MTTTGADPNAARGSADAPGAVSRMEVAAGCGLPRGRAFLLLRYMLIAATAYLVLVERGFAPAPSAIALLIAGALASNVILAGLATTAIQRPYVNALVIVIDTIWMSATLVASGRFSADFFYLYFFIALLAAIGENLLLITVTTLFASGAYLCVLQITGEGWSLWESPTIIRVPFLFTVAAFYGYLVTEARAERSRRQVSERRFRALVENGADAVALVGRDGRLAYTSPPGSRMFGRAPGEDVGRSVFALMHPDDVPVVRDRFTALLERPGATATSEFRYPHADGSWRWVDAVAQNLLDDPAVAAVVVNYRDATERKEAEAELRTHAYRERAVAELGQWALRTADPALLFDEAAVLVADVLGAPYCSLVEALGDGETLALRAAYGWDPQLAGHARAEGGPASLAGYTLHVRAPVIVTDFRTETRFLVPPVIHERGLVSALSVVIDGPDRPLGVLSAATTSPRRFGLDDLSFLRSVSNVLSAAMVRQRAQVALRESEARYRDLYEQAPDMLLTADVRTGKIVECNATLARLTGYAKEEILGRSAFDLVHPADQAAAVAMANAFLASGEVHNLRAQLRRKGGSSMHVLVNTSAVHDADGAVRYARAVWHDITRQVELEAELQRAQRMEAIGRLAGGVAHDFNNQLFVIKGYADALRKRPEGPDVVRQAEEIQRAAERAGTLTRQLLAFGRKQVLEPRVIDPNRVLSGLQDMIARLVGEHVRVVVLPGASRRVRVDPAQLEQAIMNLVVNARDAMPLGGTLTLATRDESDEWRVPSDEKEATPATRHPPPVTPQASPVASPVTRHPSLGEAVAISVRDTGTGMDAATQEHVLEPFFTTKEGGQGTGLGLSSVHGFVTQSGGRVDFESAPGRGTVFTLHLPAVDGAPEEVPADVAPPPGGPLAGTVLLAEDEIGVRKLLRGALEELGLYVLEAANGVAALEVVKRSRVPIDLLVTDVVLPYLSGPELIERLRRARPDLKVLCLSGYAEESLAQDAAARADRFLVKPCAMDVFQRAVGELLARRPEAGGRVLLVEDSPTTRALQVMLLSGAGYDVIEVADGEEAWQRLRAGRVDLVVTDISVPKMDGFALTAAIRADPALCHLPVLMLSGACGEDEQVRAREAGVSAYLDKGRTEGSELVEAVRRLLSATGTGPPALG
jgi:PAS domain S-box-containing protein